MRMEIVFPDMSDRVDALVKGLTITTHQDGSEPAPFDLFLASIGTCAGIYVSRFCRERGLPVDDIRIVQNVIPNRETRMVDRIELDIQLPEGFPEKYKDAVIRSAQLCAVKKHLEKPPAITVNTSTAVA